MKRGQASLEYLNTYGWAVFATLIMVGVLSQFNVFNPDTYLRDTCYTGNQLSCIETGIDEQGHLYLGFRNNHNVDIEIVNITTRLFNEEQHSIDHIIRRGDKRIFKLQATTDELIPPSKQEIGLRIDFKRRGGDNTYSIFGSTRTGFVSSSSATFVDLSSIRVYASAEKVWLPVCDNQDEFCNQLGFNTGNTGELIATVSAGECALFDSSTSGWMSAGGGGDIQEIICS